MAESDAAVDARATDYDAASVERITRTLSREPSAKVKAIYEKLATVYTVPADGEVAKQYYALGFIDGERSIAEAPQPYSEISTGDVLMEIREKMIGTGGFRWFEDYLLNGDAADESASFGEVIHDDTIANIVGMVLGIVDRSLKVKK